MIESVLSGISVFENLWKAGRYAVGQAKDAYQDVETQQAYLQAAKEYCRKYADRHGQVKVMPGLMKEPLLLDAIYTAVKFLDKSSLHSFVTQYDLEQVYRIEGKRSFQAEGERHDGMSVARDKPYLMVLGDPGSGKSTFLRKVGLEAFRGAFGQLKSDKVPVFIELKGFRDNDVDIFSAVVKEFKICGFPDAKALAASTLRAGKLLILLDGLDEVPLRSRNCVIEHIENFVAQHSLNSFIASCRIAAYRSSLRKFTDVTIASFDDDQIKQFIERWFSSQIDREVGTASLYWKLLKKRENAAAKELAQTPLLLTFFCLVYDREQTLPTTRSTLYGDALNIILKEWAAQKRVERDPIYEGLHPILERDLLSEIAFSTFKEDRLFFSQADIIEQISPFLSDTLGAPKHLDGAAVLSAIEVQQGILVKRAVDAYSFSHLTLQEYLVAVHIVKNQKIEVLVAQHLSNRYWREVFLLVAGAMERRGHELLASIEQCAISCLADCPALGALLEWADRMTQYTAGAYKGFEKRAAVLHVVIESLRNKSQDGNQTVDLWVDRAIANTADSTLTLSNALKVMTNGPIQGAIAMDIFERNDDAIVCYGVIDRAFEQAIALDKANCLIQLGVLSTANSQAFYSRVSALKRKIPSQAASFDEWSSAAAQLESILYKTLEITPAVVTFSPVEWQLVENYFYICELLLCCMQSSIGISRKAWERIEVNLLKPQR